MTLQVLRVMMKDVTITLIKSVTCANDDKKGNVVENQFLDIHMIDPDK